MIAVTGASGKLGRLVVEQLAAATDPSTIVATARSTDSVADLAQRGVNVRRMDYNEPDSIKAALEGVDQLLLISSSEIGQRVDQHTNVIEAAVAADVKHIAYTSILRADTSNLGLAVEHKITEEALSAAASSSDLQASFLRHGWYIENYAENLAPVLGNGAVIGAAGDGSIAAATRADYAVADAAVLLNPELWGGTYELGGNGFTLAELAEAVGAAAGREIPYVEMPEEQLRGALAAGGLPEGFVDFMVDTDLGIAKGELDADSSVLADFLGRAPSSMPEVVKQAVEAMQAA